MVEKRLTHKEMMAKAGLAMPCTVWDLTYGGRCLACGYEPKPDQGGDHETEN